MALLALVAIVALLAVALFVQQQGDAHNIAGVVLVVGVLIAVLGGSVRSGKKARHPPPDRLVAADSEPPSEPLTVRRTAARRSALAGPTLIVRMLSLTQVCANTCANKPSDCVVECARQQGA